MFKQQKTKDFIRLNIALILSFVMLFSTVASSGMALTSVFAAEKEPLANVYGDGGVNFIDKLIEIAAAGIPYKWGGWQYNASKGTGAVDCRGYVRVALRDVYNLDIFHTEGYLCNENGQAIAKNGRVLAANEKKVMIDVAAYGAETAWDDYIGQFICVENSKTGLKTYYKVLCAGKSTSIGNSQYQGNVNDIKLDGNKYSSLIAYACKFPGSIIAHNGHYGVALGEFHSKQAILDAFPELLDANGVELNNSGTSNPGAKIIRWSESAYNYGNGYDQDDLRYWFGKTAFISACSTKSGIRIDNFTTNGKVDSRKELAILLCVQPPQMTEIKVDKYDSTNKTTRVGGAQYGVYTDIACTKALINQTTGQPIVITTSDTETVTTGLISKGTYYLKEIDAPKGYSVSDDIIVVDATSDEPAKVTLTDNPVNSTILVQKFDAQDTKVVLSDTKFEIFEYSATSGDYTSILTLGYDDGFRAFTITKPYTNRLGNQFDDGSLHYTQDNEGKFRVVETKAQTGYAIDERFSTDPDFGKFDITDNISDNFIGQKAFVNNALLSLTVHKYDSFTKEPLKDVVFEFVYNGKSYTAQTDKDGIARFPNVQEGSVNTGILYEISTIEGYEIPEHYKKKPDGSGGVLVALEKSSFNRTIGAFETKLTAYNAPENTGIDMPTAGAITIYKTDGSDWFDQVFTQSQAPVEGATYGIFTDKECKNNAIDCEGNEIFPRKTGPDGKIEVANLPLGVYYIRELEAPEFYGLQLRTFVVNLIPENADGAVLHITPEGIADERQYVEINIEKVDSDSKKPVENAVYALYSDSELWISESYAFVPAHTLLGYFKTDANGKIRITNMESEMISLPDGTVFEPVTLEDPETGAPLLPDGLTYPLLVNGQYRLEEVYAPENYLKSSTIHTIDASWINPNEASLPDNYSMTDDGVILNIALKTTNTRQSVEITLTKRDEQYPEVGTKAYYGVADDNYATYAEKVMYDMAATLEGASYQLFAASDLKDINTGNIIPTGTYLGTYSTDSNGRVFFDMIAHGPYSEHLLPNGKYRVIESSPPVGYELDSSFDMEFDLTWKASNSSAIDNAKLTRSTFHDEKILSQALTIKKYDSETGAPVDGAIFSMYHAFDIFVANGYDWEGLYLNGAPKVDGCTQIDAEALGQLIKDHPELEKARDVNFEDTFTTHDGIAITGKWVYGQYILVEESPEGYLPSPAAWYVILPCEVTIVEGSAPDDQIGDDAPEFESFYSYEVSKSPETPRELTIYNTPKPPELINLTITKVWNDNDNELRVRPRALTVDIFTRDNEYVTSVILTESNNWTTTLDASYGLLKFDEDGSAISYVVVEVDPPANYTQGTPTYISSDMSNDREVILVNNINDPIKTSFTVEKRWDDNDDFFGLRPESITVQLLANGIAYGEPVTLSAPEWKHEWTDLPKFDGPFDGELIVYTVEEEAIADYSLVSSENGILVNRCTYVAPTVSFTVNKIWNDMNDLHGLRPDHVDVELLADGVVIGTVTLDDSNGWTHTWESLAAVDNAIDRNEIVYTVSEIEVANYTTAISGGTITNTIDYIVPTKNVTVNKIWHDNDNKLLLRPEFVDVALFADGVQIDTVRLSADNDWTFTFENLNVKETAQSPEISYTIQELDGDWIEYYTSTIVGNTITNTLNYAPTTVFDVEKVWIDNDDAEGYRPASVSVQLLANGEECGAPVVLNNDGDWKHQWNNLPVYDNNLDAIDYSVIELDSFTRYTSSVNGGIITNTYVPRETMYLDITKIWADNNNEYGKRPESIQVYILADGERHGRVITWQGDPEWEMHLGGFFKYQEDDVTEIQYTVEEYNVPEFYVATVDGLTITNTCTYEPPVEPPVDPPVEPIVTVVNINKYHMVGDHKFNLPGAQMRIVDENGVVAFTDDGTICAWTTDVETHTITGLAPGKYQLQEVVAPNGYYLADPVDFEILETEEPHSVEMINESTTVKFIKRDKNNSMILSGAQFALLNMDGSIAKTADGEEITWISEESGNTFDKVIPGEYIVRELTSPRGYQRAADQTVSITFANGRHEIVTLYNERAYGQLTIKKTDSKTGTPLSGVEFTITSVDTVIDPMTGEIVFNAGDIVDILITDEGGFATTKSLPIATFVDGVQKQILYRLSETKHVPGMQYNTDGIGGDFVFDLITNSPAIVTELFGIENAKPEISVTKSVINHDTFVGDYADKHDVTVVNNGDEIQYIIKVKNNGYGSGWNIVVKDAIPAHTTLLSTGGDVAVSVNNKTNVLSFVIDEIKPQQEVIVTFTVQVESDKACEIVNIAQYAMPNEKPTSADDFITADDEDVKWNDTDAVVHQVVEFHKESIVKGGTNKENATSVSCGDTIKYQLIFESTNVVNDVVFIDNVPAGLTVVDGSTKINGVVSSASFDAEKRLLVFAPISANGRTIAEFDVVVDYVDNNTTKYYENTANVEFNNGLNETENIESNTVTHKTESSLSVTKTATPNTYTGAVENAHNVTVLKAGDVVEYTLTVKNNGQNAILNALICDSVPNGLTYVSHSQPETVKAWKNGNDLTWIIDRLEVGQEIELIFKCEVTEQKAQTIVNSASYAVIDDVEDGVIPDMPTDHGVTDTVVHQVIEFHKYSVIEGGTNASDATVVNVGDKITYILEVITKHQLTNVQFADNLPAGLTLLTDSFMVKANDGEWQSITDDVDAEGFTVEPGTFAIKFDVTVDDVPVGVDTIYINKAELSYNQFPGDVYGEDSEGTLESEEVSHMTNINISGSKTGTIETYIGDYAEKNNVTIVKDGDLLEYVITVNNDGLSAIKDLIIQDKLPEFTNFVSASDDGLFDEETGVITWKFDVLPADQSVAVKLVVKCATDGQAKEIRNVAQYAFSDNEWIVTDEVIYQTIALRKEASIDTGITDKDAKYIAIGSKFTYKIFLDNTNEINNVMVTDVIPTGLAFVPSTAYYQINDGDLIHIEEIAVLENNELQFPVISKLPAGTTAFFFDVEVLDVEEFDKDYYFINIASVIATERADSENGVEITSNVVSNSTKKTETIETPKLGFDNIDPIVMWTTIAFVSAIATLMLGWYGFGFDKKNSKKD